MIPRRLAPLLEEAALGFPVVTVTGPRQSGKTTLCRATFPELVWVSLEDPDHREYARVDPRGFLHTWREGAIIDEIQRVPELVSYLQTEVDRDPRPGRFVLTGSEHLSLSQATSQSLAGRTAILHLLPLSWRELQATPAKDDDLDTTLWRGGYPAIFDRQLTPDRWHAAYAATYVERDVRQLREIGDLSAFQDFLALCAGRSGQLLNLSALGGDAGITQPTARAWVSVLEASWLALRLRPWHRNLGKRLVKTPKLYFYDTGLLCWLLGIREPEQLAAHPLRGAIFETWVVSELLKEHYHRGISPRASFYRDQRGLEVDLLVERTADVLAVEAKSGRTAAADFWRPLAELQLLWQEPINPRPLRSAVVYGGDQPQHRSGGELVPWNRVHTLLDEP
ncbi:MAG: ATP-binding protein [Deltaproteobacteria bacterium]|nr:ATP-binding protein [Deltaproteobacteria bacterium]